MEITISIYSVYFYLFYPYWTTSGILCPALGPPIKERFNKYRDDCEEESLENIPYRKRWRELGVFRLEKRGFGGNLLSAFQYYALVLKKTKQVSLLRYMTGGWKKMVSS